MTDLTTAELDHLYEASKYDHNFVVGSEVRQMIGMIRRRNARIEQLEAAQSRAERALRRAGWTYMEGAEEWKPPLGPSASPLLDRIEALEAENADLRRWKALDKPVTAAMSIANSHLAPLHARIEQLEAALRNLLDKLEILNGCNEYDLNGENPLPEVIAARTALDQKDAGIGCGKSVIEPWAPEQDK